MFCEINQQSSPVSRAIISCTLFSYKSYKSINGDTLFLGYSKLIASKLGCNFVDCFVFCFRNFNEYIHNEEYLGYDEDDKYIWPKSQLE